jgi:hypothetical protein
MVKLKPPTAGVSLLSMDGGGIRGIVSIESLALVQSAFGSLCKIQDMFDMVFGTSAGRLERNWPWHSLETKLVQAVSSLLVSLRRIGISRNAGKFSRR